MNKTTPDKLEKLWNDWCVERVNEMTDEKLFNFAVDQMKLQYISHVYKHQGHVPDYPTLLEDIFDHYDGDQEEVESHLNMYDITLEKFEEHP
tara:strand:+ start:314 stop:589 length:276 start_codon:yes stop_codon:yes gene_type:complete